MITKMTKYAFIMLNGETEDFLKKLQGLGVVDITRSKKPVDGVSSAMLEKAAEIKKAAALLEKADYSKDEDSEAIMKAAETAALPEDAATAALDTVSELEKLKMQLSQANKETAERKPWGDFDPAEIRKLENEGYTFRWYKAAKKKFRDEWASEYALQVIEDDGSSVWFVTVSRSGEEYSFPLPETAAPAGSWKESQAEAERIKNEIISAKARLLKMKECIQGLHEAYSNELADLDLYLAGAAKETAADNMVTVLTGFAPADDDERLSKEFDSMDLAYIKDSAVEEDNPPIKLKNNWFTKQFEVLTGMYGMPVYSEFDPTPVLGPFFLLFFAMCMGDAGYWILLIFIGQFLRKMKGSMAKLGPLVTILGVGCIFVGIILGTFFGINLAEASWVPEWLKKCMITGEIAGYSSQMVLAVGIGVFHICLAMTIKAVCYTKRFGFKENISTWAWLIFIIGGIVTAGMALLGVISEPATKWTVIVLGIVSGLGIYIFNTPGRNPLINVGAGLWDTYNMATGLMGDTLSYIRLYALGLAGGMLGGVFNLLAFQVNDAAGGVLGWICCGLILVFGHSLNIAMSCLSAFVHPLRLTFVEYFKNSGYDGKGEPYKPFALAKDINGKNK